MTKFFKWVVEIEVSETWVEDGFDLDEERLHDMVRADLTYAASDEIRVKVIKAPAESEIRAMQGYTSEDANSA